MEPPSNHGYTDDTWPRKLHCGYQNKESICLISWIHVAIKLFLSISSREVSKLHLFIVSTTLKKVNRSEGDGNSPCSEVHKDMLEDLRRCRRSSGGLGIHRHGRWKISSWQSVMVIYPTWSATASVAFVSYCMKYIASKYLCVVEMV